MRLFSSSLKLRNENISSMEREQTEFAAFKRLETRRVVRAAPRSSRELKDPVGERFAQALKRVEEILEAEAAFFDGHDREEARERREQKEVLGRAFLRGSSIVDRARALEIVDYMCDNKKYFKDQKALKLLYDELEAEQG